MSTAIDKLRKFDFQRYGYLFAFVLLFVISAILSPYFTKPENLINILRQVAYTGIIALGMAIVIIGGGIDLSVGSMAAFVGAISVIIVNWLLPFMSRPSLAVTIGAVAAVLMGLAGGAINGILVTRARIAPFIVTLGTMAIFRSLTLYIGEAGEFRSATESLGQFGMASIWFVPVPVVVMLVMAAALSLILNSTRYGRYVFAVGSNSRVALYSAINVERTRFLTYVIIGLCVGVSAFLLAARFNSISSSNAGVGFELDAIAAVIVGGTAMSGGRGTIWGTIVGAVILGIINNMLNMMSVSPYLQGTVRGIIIIGAVYIQRQRQ
jgi:ribose transport system permease protein